MSSEIKILGIDLGKNWFHDIGIDHVRRPVLCRNRVQLQELAPYDAMFCRIGSGSESWGRRFAPQGLQVRCVPARFIKPYLKANKKDFNDALAIAEAANWATIPS